MRRGKPQNNNFQKQKPRLRLVDGILPVKKNVGVSKDNASLIVQPSHQVQSVKAIERQPKKIVAQTPRVYQSRLPKQPQKEQPEKAQSYQFEPPKPKRTETEEPSFFEIPLAQEYEKDLAEKGGIYKRFVIAGSFFVILFSLIISGVFLFKKQNGVQEMVYAHSDAGKNSLVAAQDYLIKLDFENAEESFTDAYEDFGEIEKELLSLGQSNILMGKVPNNDSMIFQGEKLVAVAKNLSLAGKEVTSCASLFGNVSLLSGKEIDSWYSFKIAGERLDKADKALGYAQNNLSYIDKETLPEVADLISELKDKLPIYQETLSLFKNVIEEVPQLLGKEKPQDYLVLFQNPAEARATGGFLGNYGLLSFDKGKMNGPSVFDIYKLKWLSEGKRNFIKPPQEVYEADIKLWQKGSFELWDANWDIDFPTAAKKIEWYYEQYNQSLVEGVIAMDPIVFSDVLKIMGPISMKKYGVVINSQNFWKIMEKKVERDNPFKRGEAEYKDANPKQILKDFAYLLMAKIKKADDAKRQEVTKSMYENIKRKHLLLFSNNHNLQAIFEKLNWSGKIMAGSNDYLYVNESNVGVNKSSSRIRQSFDLTVDVSSGQIKNSLKIIRKHLGSKKTPITGRNLSYLRILAPYGSTLNSISVDGKDVAPKVVLGEENGKTKFGIKTSLQPQTTQIIEIVYTLPFKLEVTSITPKYYSLYVQKQPGKINDKLSVNVNIDPSFKINSIDSEKGGNFTENQIEFESDLLEDRVFRILLSK